MVLLGEAADSGDVHVDGELELEHACAGEKE